MRKPFLLAVLSTALLAVACATRANAPPAGSASPLSPSHRPAATPSVTLALDEDPPLPGEAEGGWTGLDPNARRNDAPADAAVDPPAQHHGGGHAH